MSDLISRQNLVNAKFVNVVNEYTLGWNDAIDAIIENEPSVEPEVIACGEGELIRRQDAIDALGDKGLITAMVVIDKVPSAEPLTDIEQRIFLKAMGREEEVCKIVDEEYKDEGYKLNLVHVCHEIKRKVKGALWT